MNLVKLSQIYCRSSRLSRVRGMHFIHAKVSTYFYISTEKAFTMINFGAVFPVLSRQTQRCSLVNMADKPSKVLPLGIVVSHPHFDHTFSLYRGRSRTLKPGLEVHMRDFYAYFLTQHMC